MKRILLLCLSLTLFFPFTAVGETKDAKIERLLDSMKTMENIEASLLSMKDTIKMNSPYFIKEIKVILAREMEEEDVQLLADKYREDDFGPERLYELFRYKFNLDRVKKEILLPAYRDNYTADEIDQLIAFYRSDLGQKTLELTPMITSTITSETRDISQMALNQAKEELAFELQNSLKKQ